MAKDQNQKPEENGNPSWVSSICAPKNTLENYVGMADPTQHNQKKDIGGGVDDSQQQTSDHRHLLQGFHQERKS